MRAPVAPRQAPERTRSARSAMRSSTSCTAPTTSSPPVWIRVPRGARSATWSTARSSETLMCSPANIAAMRSSRPASRASRTSSASVCGVTRWRVTSSSMPSASNVSASARPGSASNSSRSVRPDSSRACASTAAHDGSRSSAWASTAIGSAPRRDGRALPGDALEQRVPACDERVGPRLLQVRCVGVDVDPRGGEPLEAAPRPRRRPPPSGAAARRRGRRTPAASPRASC